MLANDLIYFWRPGNISKFARNKKNLNANIIQTKLNFITIQFRVILLFILINTQYLLFTIYFLFTNYFQFFVSLFTDLFQPKDPGTQQAIQKQNKKLF